MAKITKTALGFEREPLVMPFGFKGKYVGELWHTVAGIQNDLGMWGLGLGLQSVLWSDSRVFSKFSPPAGNSVMLLMTEYALSLLKDMGLPELLDPIALTDEIFSRVYQYGQDISGVRDLKKTFALNALVPVDMALWRLYAHKNNIRSFDAMMPGFAKPALQGRQRRLASVPLVTYGIGTDAVAGLAREGAFLLKIKLGNDPSGNSDPGEMLSWDKRRLSEIHGALGPYATPYTENGKIAYYLDANGRYDSRDNLMRLVEHTDKIGALGQIAIFEEPFSEDMPLDVSDLPLCLAADESVHSAEDADRLMDMGYRAIALKPIAKTLGMSLKILERAHKRGVPCFCADLTVNPLMSEWNKNLAARLSTLPGIKTGIMEQNGPQYYADWARMKSYHPMGDCTWVDPRDGFFELDDGFYAHSGGIFEDAPHYGAMINQ